MALTLGPNGITMANGSEITTGGQPRSLRWTSTSDNVAQTGAGQSADTYLNLELTMPAAVDNDSIYLLYGHSNFDDQGGSRGIGLSFWMEQQGTSEWVGRQGYHCHYDTKPGDRYYNQHYWLMDNKWADGNQAGGNYGNSIRPVAGVTRKYRMYYLANNSNMIGNCNYITAQAGPSGFFMCLELDGNLMPTNYGKPT